MRLTRDEAICLVLELSENKAISSPTKLNKLLARLNLHFIPVDINFSLNKYGSFNSDLKHLEGNQYYQIEEYTLKSGMPSKRFILTATGEELFDSIIKSKINEILTKEDFAELKEEIKSLSILNADEISGNEHKKLLVDVEDRYKLEQNTNTTFCDMLDLFDKINEIPEDTMAEISLKALIEYCFNLIKYIKDVRFKKIPEDYDYDAYMFDYYFLHNINEIVPFLNEQVAKKEKDGIRINKYYQYFVNSVQENNYPFSLDNENLDKLIAS